jgi:hypothetical protein
MLRGYRFLVAAACGLVLFVALGTGAFFGALYSPDHKQYQTVAGQQSGQNDYTGPSQSLPDISGVPGPVERAIANPHPSTGQDHEKRDLAAQEASALWAFWMVVASGLGFIITTIATILLYQQIRLTREAVQDTGLATEAMQEANRIARRAQMTQRSEAMKAMIKERQSIKRIAEAEQRQLRAYIGLTKWHQIVHGSKHTFEIYIKNFGQTPAINLRVARAFKAGSDLDYDALNFGDRPGVHIAPGSEWNRIAANMMAVNGPACYVAEIRYQDVFGNEWALRVGYVRNVQGEWHTGPDGTREYQVQ